MQVREHAVQAFALLDVWEDFKRMAATRLTLPQAEQALARLQVKAERVYKRKALVAHPDKGGSTEAMAALNAARDLVKAVRATPPPRPRPTIIHQTVVVRMHSTFTSTTFTGTSSDTTGYY